MLKRPAGAWAVALAAAIAATAPSAQTAAELPFEHAVAAHGCTQEDGRALELYLTARPVGGALPPPPPFVRIEVPWSAWPALLGRAVPLIGLSGAAAAPGVVRVRAALHREDGSAHWLTGTLTLLRVDAGRHVDAVFEFSNGSGGLRRGAIAAAWSDTPQMCG